MSMHQIVTEIGIAAPPSAIWQILTDFSTYAEWNPFIRRISGKVACGSRLTILIAPPTGRSFTFRPRISGLVENKELRWKGRALVPGLFDGEHYFQIDATHPGGSQVIHGERFSGVLVYALKGYLDRAVRAGFIEMNQALKSRVEHG